MHRRRIQESTQITRHSRMDFLHRNSRRPRWDSPGPVRLLTPDQWIRQLTTIPTHQPAIIRLIPAHRDLLIRTCLKMDSPDFNLVRRRHRQVSFVDRLESFESYKLFSRSDEGTRSGCFRLLRPARTELRFRTTASVLRESAFLLWTGSQEAAVSSLDA